MIVRLLTCLLAALLLGAAPASADPETTGGLQAGEPPVLSPQGGVNGSGAAPPATAAQGDEEDPADQEPTQTAPDSTIPQAPVDEEDSTVDVPVADPAPATEPATTRTASSGGGGGGLPHTGFALAALLAIGVCFVLTGYALRYSRALDG